LNPLSTEKEMYKMRMWRARLTTSLMKMLLRQCERGDLRLQFTKDESSNAKGACRLYFGFEEMAAVGAPNGLGRHAGCCCNGRASLRPRVVLSVGHTDYLRS
jgi:hypothetical protein